MDWPCGSSFAASKSLPRPEHCKRVFEDNILCMNLELLCKANTRQTCSLIWENHIQLSNYFTERHPQTCYELPRSQLYDINYFGQKIFYWIYTKIKSSKGMLTFHFGAAFSLSRYAKVISMDRYNSSTPGKIAKLINAAQKQLFASIFLEPQMDIDKLDTSWFPEELSISK